MPFMAPDVQPTGLGIFITSRFASTQGRDQFRVIGANRRHTRPVAENGLLPLSGAK